MADTYESSSYDSEPFSTSPFQSVLNPCHSEGFFGEESAFAFFGLPGSSPIKSVDQLPPERCAESGAR
jgi:hypothetical protein